MKTKINVFWHRRDLRLSDNAGLFHALKAGRPVLSLFIFDKEILSRLEDKADARVGFIQQQLEVLTKQLQALGSALLVRVGKPIEVWKELLDEFDIEGVYCNSDYEAYAIARDLELKTFLAIKNIPFFSFKDQVIFEKLEVVKKDGTPYTVFTPYARTWKSLLFSRLDQSGDYFYLKSYPNELYQKNYLAFDQVALPSLESLGFVKNDLIEIPPATVDEEILANYTDNRDYPALKGTSRLGVHLRFGTISIRALARKALASNETYLNELIWRDFYAMILANFPEVEKQSFRPAYDQIEWRNDEAEFEKWCLGQTGYPLVDAGMRELNATGFMHNRVRMVVASFLTKHLLIDWRWGEAYFAQKLLDFELASNNGGWQWAAGSGTDAAPYFRIFNPSTQLTKFDKKMLYVKKWVKEFGTDQYPEPIVDHAFARARCLEVYKMALNP